MIDPWTALRAPVWAWAQWRARSLVDVPRPRDAPRAHTPGPDAVDVLIVPGGKPTMFYAIMMFGEPGKEILYPVAIVILGGLVSSTVLGLAATPALFYTFCRRTAEKIIAREAPATH